MRRAGMDEARRVWLERVLEACVRALTRLAERDDAHPWLVSDIESLRARLQAELSEDRAGSSSP
jgi:hypothetical protein